MSKEMTIEEIKKNNELFSNSLTFKIVWKSNFIKLLISGGFEKSYVDNYTQVIEKYLKDFENQLNLHLEKLQK